MGTVCHRGALALALVALPVTAQASPRREGAMFGAALGAGGFTSDCDRCDTGPAAGALLRLGFLGGDHARLGVMVEASVSESWHEAGRLVHATIGLGIATWIEERVSLSFSLGGTAADSGIEGEGFATGGVALLGTVGYDVRHWRRSALVVRAGLGGGQFDEGWGTQLLLTIGVDGFEMGSDPPPPPR